MSSVFAAEPRHTTVAPPARPRAEVIELPLIADMQITAILYTPQPLAGELIVHGALDVPIQELVAPRHRHPIDPLVCLVHAELDGPVVVESHFLGERGCAQTHKRRQMNVLHILVCLSTIFSLHTDLLSILPGSKGVVRHMIARGRALAPAFVEIGIIAFP